MSDAPVTPEVLWAQRSSDSEPAKNFIYLTISVPDVQPSKLKLDLKENSLTFTGHSESLKRTYHVELEFYAEIDPKESKINHSAKNVEMILRKKELKAEFWPRLLKDAKKVHFLKTDFDKWVDEDEQNEAPEDDFGNLGGDMSSMMGGGDFGGIDFSKLGGGANVGEGGSDDEEEDGDDDMPELEEEGESKKENPKIEEVA
ncbi:Hsp90 binding co-chaperone Sba1 [Xylogone sp. PMI_703]|nr:Hsp90 binding co-chaperone Sba1 [Xylogone sp. PMI_703]